MQAELDLAFFFFLGGGGGVGSGGGGVRGGLEERWLDILSESDRQMIHMKFQTLFSKETIRKIYFRMSSAAVFLTI